MFDLQTSLKYYILNINKNCTRMTPASARVERLLLCEYGVHNGHFQRLWLYKDDALIFLMNGRKGNAQFCGIVYPNVK